MSKISFGYDKMEVSIYKNENTVTFVNGTAGDAYSWDIVDGMTGELVFRQPFTENPSFAYTFPVGHFMEVIARIGGSTKMSAKVYTNSCDPGMIPQPRLMYVNTGRYFRFTDTAPVEGLSVRWAIYKVDGEREEIDSISEEGANEFEVRLDAGAYRVKALICDAEGRTVVRSLTDVPEMSAALI